jgi:hypothetical protein
MSRSAFATGLLAGAWAVLAGAVLIFVMRRIHRSSGGLGAFVAAGALIALELYRPIADDVPIAVAAGIALLAVGGLVQNRWPRWHGSLAFVPGAAVLGGAPFDGVSMGTHITIAVVAWGAAIAATDFEQHHAPDGFALWLLPVASLVPALMIDGGTEAGWILVGAMVPLVVNVVPGPRARLGPSGAAPLVGVYLWVGVLVADNRGARLAALVGGLGFVLCEPIARALAALERHSSERKPSKLEEWPGVVVATAVLGQLAVALFAVFVTGRNRRAEIGMLALIPVLVAATTFARAFVPSPSRRRAPRRRAARARASSSRSGSSRSRESARSSRGREYRSRSAHRPERPRGSRGRGGSR